MHVEMPQLGETVAEGTITTWYKRVGDRIKAGETLFDVETDKASMEVPAIASGVLSEICVQAGDVAPVGAVVAIIAEKDVGASEPQDTESQPRELQNREAPKVQGAASNAPPSAATRSTAVTASRPARVMTPFAEVI